MASTKKRLGRGLDALLDPMMISDDGKDRNEIKEVDILSIDTNLKQPRKSFSEESLKELSSSIKTHGIVQPLIVKKNGDRYLIVAGERRYRAARMAGIKKIPVILVDYDDKKMQEVSLIENIQREDLNPIEEAYAIRFLMQQYDLTQEEISERIGKSRPVIANSLRLLSLPEKVIDMIRNDSLSAGHGRAIAGISDPGIQSELAAETVENGYSVRELEKRIQNLNKGKKTGTKTAAPKSNDIRYLEDQFREKTGMKVSVKGSEEKGRIVFEYGSKDQLQQFFDLIAE